MKKELLNIKIQPLPNGYALTVNKSEYMYFNPKELLEGFIYHVGLEELDEVDSETRHNIIAAAIAWKENGKAIKELVKLREEYERIESQNKNFKTKLDRANKTIKKLNNNKNNVDDDESIE